MPPLPETLRECRALFDDLTPLHGDCGRLCGGACCESVPGEETGMLLFPGEEGWYAALPGYRIVDSSLGPVLVCSGRCDRKDRPLSCRLFPLLPVLRESGVKAAVDRRARAVCPLAGQGLRALDPAFVQAVRECGRRLSSDPEQRAFLARLTAQQDDLTALQLQFSRRKDHV